MNRTAVIVSGLLCAAPVAAHADTVPALVIDLPAVPGPPPLHYVVHDPCTVCSKTPAATPAAPPPPPPPPPPPSPYPELSGNWNRYPQTSLAKVRAATPGAFAPDALFDLTARPAADQSALTGAMLAAVTSKVEYAYPDRAFVDEIEGSADVDCQWSAAGGLTNCAWETETPGGYQIGDVSVHLLETQMPDGLANTVPGARPGAWSRFRIVWHLTRYQVPVTGHKQSVALPHG